MKKWINFLILTFSIVETCPRIVGGCSSKGYPWLGAIWSNGSGVHCGTSLIHPNWAVTAAHCIIGDISLFYESNNNLMENISGNMFLDTIIGTGSIVKFGLRLQSENSSSYVTNRFIKSIHCHPEYYK